MATAEELLASSSDDVLVIDLESRVITIPDSIENLGVESDDDVKRLKFKIPCKYGEFDLSEFAFRINYTNANGEGDVYKVDDVTVDGDYIFFSWLVGRFALTYKGDVGFVACLKKMAEDGTVVKEFNTTVATLPVLEGKETGEAVIQENPDILEEMLLKLGNVDSALDRIIEIQNELIGGDAV